MTILSWLYDSVYMAYNSDYLQCDFNGIVHQGAPLIIIRMNVQSKFTSVDNPLR